MIIVLIIIDDHQFIMFFYSKIYLIFAHFIEIQIICFLITTLVLNFENFQLNLAQFQLKTPFYFFIIENLSLN